MDQASLNHFLSKFPFRLVENSDPSKPPRMVTCVCRLAFASLGKAKVRVSQQTGEKTEEYTATLIVPAAADLSVPRALAGRIAEQRFGANWKAMELRNPLRPQAKNAGKYDGFEAEGVYFDTSSRYPVEVVGPKRVNGAFPVLDCNSDAVYSGMWVIATLEPYAYPKPGSKDLGNRGVKFGLRALQKVADDEEFKGASASASFEDVDYSGVSPAVKGSGAAGVSAPMTPVDSWM